MLWRAARMAGWATLRFHDWNETETISIEQEEEVAIYGEPLFATRVAAQLERVLLEAPFDWLCSLPEEYLKRRVGYTSFYNIADLEYPTFLKPADDKRFRAQVFASPDDVPHYGLESEEVPMLYSEPVHFQSEFRAFVCEREFRTVCAYARDGQPIEDSRTIRSPRSSAPDVREFLHQIVHDRRVQLPPAAVIDVGWMNGRGWGVIEANPIWASAVYSCDPLEALMAIARACIPRAKAKSEMAKWILDRPVPDTN